MVMPWPSWPSCGQCNVPDGHNGLAGVGDVHGWNNLTPVSRYNAHRGEVVKNTKHCNWNKKNLEKTHFENFTKVLTCSFHTSTNSLAHKPDFLSVCPPIKQQNRLCAKYKISNKMDIIGLPLHVKQNTKYDIKYSMKNQIPNYKPNKVLPPPTPEVAQTEFA